MIIRVILVLGMELLVLFVGLLVFSAGFVVEFGHTRPALFEQGIRIFEGLDQSVLCPKRNCDGDCGIKEPWRARDETTSRKRESTMNVSRRTTNRLS
jgi:hypothetical protein